MLANLYIDRRVEGVWLPNKGDFIPGIHENVQLSGVDITCLFEQGFDVMLTHTTLQVSIRRKPREEGLPLVMVDEFGGRFRVR